MITYAMFSRQGKRENNEDCIRMKEKKGASVFLLADGLTDKDCITLLNR